MCGSLTWQLDRDARNSNEGGHWPSPSAPPSRAPPSSHVGIVAVGVGRWTTIIREDLGAASRDDDDDGMSRETPIGGAVVRQLYADTGPIGCCDLNGQEATGFQNG